MLAQSPARYLAPLAIAAVFVALILIVGGSGGSNDASSTPTRSQPGKTQSKRKTAARPKAAPKTYIVQSGDTLAQIALNTGVSADRLLIINPDLDPNALQVGQKIKLRP